MSDPSALRLVAGGQGPAQIGATDCGPTALLTARLLGDPGLLRWLDTGETADLAPDEAQTLESAVVSLVPAAVPAAPSAIGSAEARVAAYLHVVHRRTNALRGPTGRLQLPWPRRLGTPHWAAARELERTIPASDYRTVPVRRLGPDALRRVTAQLVEHVRPGRPGLLYVGSVWLPRHVTLVVGDPDSAGVMLVHDPADGSVGALDVDRLARRERYLGGWTHPWLLVGPVD